MRNHMDFTVLETAINYTFHNQELLVNALTHSSYANELQIHKREDNERLEFLGDAVLELVSSEYLYTQYRHYNEGKLTTLRASMVCEPSLAYCARKLHLEDYIMLGKGEEATGGRKRDSITSDALEAVIGAVYLDGGFEQAKKFIMQFILNDLEGNRLFYDSKTVLQEMLQANGNTPSYRIVNESGPEHDKVFTAEVMMDDKVLGVGEGHNKKSAEQKAAYEAIIKLRK